MSNGCALTVAAGRVLTLENFGACKGVLPSTASTAALPVNSGPDKMSGLFGGEFDENTEATGRRLPIAARHVPCTVTRSVTWKAKVARKESV